MWYEKELQWLNVTYLICKFYICTCSCYLSIPNATNVITVIKFYCRVYVQLLMTQLQQLRTKLVIKNRSSKKRCVFLAY